MDIGGKTVQVEPLHQKAIIFYTTFIDKAMEHQFGKIASDMKIEFYFKFLMQKKKNR